jgi:hypothetical protein
LAQGDIDDLWQRFADQLSITFEENISEGKSMPRKYDTPWRNDESKTALIKKKENYGKNINTTEIHKTKRNIRSKE